MSGVVCLGSVETSSASAAAAFAARRGVGRGWPSLLGALDGLLAAGDAGRGGGRGAFAGYPAGDGVVPLDPSCLSSREAVLGPAGSAYSLSGLVAGRPLMALERKMGA